MALPVIAVPTYELIIPSTKVKVKYRPFLVKEQKALLIAQQSEEQSSMFATLVDVIRACTFDKVDTKKLAIFDIEYIFTQLRARSVGEVSELVFSCLECNDPLGKSKVSIDLTKLEVIFDKKHSKIIKLSDTIGMTMRYPGITEMDILNNIHTIDINNIFAVAAACVESIYDSDSVFNASDFSKEEIAAFLDALTQDQFKQVQQFFETMPKLEKKVEFDCPKCGFHHTQTLKGLESFF